MSGRIRLSLSDAAPGPEHGDRAWSVADDLCYLRRMSQCGDVRPAGRSRLGSGRHRRANVGRRNHAMCPTALRQWRAAGADRADAGQYRSCRIGGGACPKLGPSFRDARRNGGPLRIRGAFRPSESALPPEIRTGAGCNYVAPEGGLKSGVYIAFARRLAPRKNRKDHRQ